MDKATRSSWEYEHILEEKGKAPMIEESEEEKVDQTAIQVRNKVGTYTIQF